MLTKSSLTAAAIALAAGVGTAAADEISGSSGGFTAFNTLAGVQAIPLDTDEMAAVIGMDWFAYNRNSGVYRPLKIKGNNIWDEENGMHGVKYNGGGYPAHWDTYYGCDPHYCYLTHDIHGIP